MQPGVGLRTSVILVVLMIVSVSTTTSVAAERFLEDDIDIEIEPDSDVYTNLQNRADPAGYVTNYDGWTVADPGVYVGSFTPESSFDVEHEVENPTIHYLVVQYDVTFSASQIMSGVIDTWVRLPFAVSIRDNVSLSLRRMDLGTNLIDDVQVHTGLSWIAAGADAPSGIVSTYGEDDRAYYLHHGHILSGVTYRWSWTLTTDVAEEVHRVYFADDDVADDGDVGCVVVNYDEYDGVPGGVAEDFDADCGHSYVFVSGAPSHGLVGTAVHIHTHAVDATRNETLALRREGINLSAQVNATRDVLIHVPLYSPYDVAMNATLNVSLCNVTLGSRVVAIEDSFIWRNQSVVFDYSTYGNMTSCDLVVTYWPHDTKADDVVVLASLAYQTIDDDPSTPSDYVALTAPTVAGGNFSRLGFYRPAMHLQLMNASVAAPTTVQHSTSGSDVFLVLLDPRAVYSVFTAVYRSSTIRYVSCAVATGIHPVSGLLCSGRHGAVESAADAAGQLGADLADLVARGADVVYDIRNGDITLETILGDVADASGFSAMMSAVDTWGSSIIATVTRLIEEVAHYLAQVLMLIMIGIGVAALVATTTVTMSLWDEFDRGQGLPEAY